jgi:hypothetical protein
VSYRISLMDCERQLLDEIADKRLTRDDVAMTYAMSLVSDERNRISWQTVNYAIIDRWSPSALKYIKDKAWRMVERRKVA